MSLYNLPWYGWILFTLSISSVAWNIFAAVLVASGKARLRSLSAGYFLGMAILVALTLYLMHP